MPDDVKKRNIAFEKLISNITKDDVRVSVIGTVVSTDDEALIFIIDDTTGSLNILAPSEELFKKVKPGSFVRVIGLVLPHESGCELRAEIIQDFSDLDKELFPVLQNLVKK